MTTKKTQRRLNLPEVSVEKLAGELVVTAASSYRLIFFSFLVSAKTLAKLAKSLATALVILASLKVGMGA